MRNTLFSLLCILMLLTQSANAAEPGVHDPSIPGAPAEVCGSVSLWEKRNNLMFSLGLAMPTGFLGIEYAFDITKDIQIAFGGGFGRGGIQGSSMVRWRYIGDGNSFYRIGIGASAGQTFESTLFVPHREDGEEFGIKTGIWANAEISYGWRYKSGFQMAWTLGITRLVNPDNVECLENCWHTSAGGTEVYTRLTPESEEVSMAVFFIYVGLSLGSTF